MIAVICKNKRQFDEWLTPWVNQSDYHKFKAITKLDDLMGLRFTEVIKIGDYNNLLDYNEIVETAYTRIQND